MINEKCVCNEYATFSFKGSRNSDMGIIMDLVTDKMTMLCYMAMKTEFGKADLDINAHRWGYLYAHEKPNKLCKEWSLTRAINEMSSKPYILLLGAETVKYFTGEAVDTVSSLEVKSDYFGQAKFIMAGVNPSTAIARTIGEFRLVCKRWSEFLSTQ